MDTSPGHPLSLAGEVWAQRRGGGCFDLSGLHVGLLNALGRLMCKKRGEEPRPIGGGPGLGGRGLSESVTNVPLGAQSPWWVRLCLEGGGLRGGWALGEPSELLQKGPGPENQWRQVGQAQPFPSRPDTLDGCSCWVGPASAEPPATAAGRKELLISIVWLFPTSFCFRDPLLRENNAPHKAQLPGGRPPRPAGHGGLAHGFDLCPPSLGAQWASGALGVPACCGWFCPGGLGASPPRPISFMSIIIIIVVVECYF